MTRFRGLACKPTDYGCINILFERFLFLEKSACCTQLSTGIKMTRNSLERATFCKQSADEFTSSGF